MEKSGCVRADVDGFLLIEQCLSQHGMLFPQWAGASEWSYEVPLGI